MSDRNFDDLRIQNESLNIADFVEQYARRIRKQLIQTEEEVGGENSFILFGYKKPTAKPITWLEDNEKRFFVNTPNERLSAYFLSQCGFILTVVFSPDGKYVIAGYSSGLIQANIMSEEINNIIKEFSDSIHSYYFKSAETWYPMFYEGRPKQKERDISWVQENYKTFLKNTPNEILFNRWFCSECGAITALQYSPNGSFILVCHESGLIQMRHGSTGAVLCTLRNVQFPPQPIYAVEFSRTDERVCYAACMDGSVYKIEIPHIDISVDDPPEYCIRADPALESITTQFYGNPGISSHATQFISQRSAALSVGASSGFEKLVVGYEDGSIKIYDLGTREAETTYKIHKLRLQFIPKKLQRIHFGQVCALKCHDQKPNVFVSGAWDNTLRVWDIRCKVGCVMTFEGVDIRSDSLDVNRDHCITGSWQTSESLSVWDIVAKKRLSIVRVQNRRPDVDGEYLYACRYWRSKDFNRKGKYAIVGGSGTNCVEVINLHNRYISCSYPADGTVLAVASYQERIAFGGTAPVFNIVTFHDPKHERYLREDSDQDFYLNKAFDFDSQSDF